MYQYRSSMPNLLNKLSCSHKLTVDRFDSHLHFDRHPCSSIFDGLFQRYEVHVLINIIHYIILAVVIIFLMRELKGFATNGPCNEKKALNGTPEEIKTRQLFEFEPNMLYTPAVISYAPTSMIEKKAEHTYLLNIGAILAKTDGSNNIVKMYRFLTMENILGTNDKLIIVKLENNQLSFIHLIGAFESVQEEITEKKENGNYMTILPIIIDRMTLHGDEQITTRITIHFNNLPNGSAHAGYNYNMMHHTQFTLGTLSNLNVSMMVTGKPLQELTYSTLDGSIDPSCMNVRKKEGGGVIGMIVIVGILLIIIPTLMLAYTIRNAEQLHSKSLERQPVDRVKLLMGHVIKCTIACMVGVGWFYFEQGGVEGLKTLLPIGSLEFEFNQKYIVWYIFSLMLVIMLMLTIVTFIYNLKRSKTFGISSSSKWSFIIMVIIMIAFILINIGSLMSDILVDHLESFQCAILTCVLYFSEYIGVNSGIYTVVPNEDLEQEYLNYELAKQDVLIELMEKQIDQVTRDNANYQKLTEKMKQNMYSSMGKIRDGAQSVLPTMTGMRSSVNTLADKARNRARATSPSMTGTRSGIERLTNKARDRVRAASPTMSGMRSSVNTLADKARDRVRSVSPSNTLSNLSSRISNLASSSSSSPSERASRMSNMVNMANMANMASPFTNSKLRKSLPTTAGLSSRMSKLANTTSAFANPTSRLSPLFKSSKRITSNSPNMSQIGKSFSSLMNKKFIQKGGKGNVDNKDTNTAATVTTTPDSETDKPTVVLTSKQRRTDALEKLIEKMKNTPDATIGTVQWGGFYYNMYYIVMTIVLLTWSITAAKNPQPGFEKTQVKHWSNIFNIICIVGIVALLVYLMYRPMGFGYFPLVVLLYRIVIDIILTNNPYKTLQDLLIPFHRQTTSFVPYDKQSIGDRFKATWIFIIPTLIHVLSETHTEDATFYTIRVQQWLNLYDHMTSLYRLNKQEILEAKKETLDAQRKKIQEQIQKVPLAQMQPAQMQPAQMQPAQMQPAQMHPAQMQPAQMQSAQELPAQELPAQEPQPQKGGNANTQDEQVQKMMQQVDEMKGKVVGSDKMFSIKKKFDAWEKDMKTIKRVLDESRSELWSYTLLIALVFNIIGSSNILKNIYNNKLKNLSHTTILFAYIVFSPFILFITNRFLSKPLYIVTVIFSIAFIVSMMCTSINRSKFTTNSFSLVGIIALMGIWNNFAQTRDNLIVIGSSVRQWQRASVKYIIVFGLALLLTCWNISTNDPMPYMQLDKLPSHGSRKRSDSSNPGLHGVGSISYMNQCKIKNVVNISLWCFVAILVPLIVVSLLFLS